MTLSNSTYETLKYFAQIVLPASEALWLALAKIWGLPYGVEIGATIAAVDLFLGALLKVSTNKYEIENLDIERHDDDRSDDAPNFGEEA